MILLKQEYLEKQRSYRANTKQTRNKEVTRQKFSGMIFEFRDVYQCPEQVSYLPKYHDNCLLKSRTRQRQATNTRARRDKTLDQSRERPR